MTSETPFEFDPELRMLKGAHLIFNQELLDFLRRTLQEIDSVYTDTQNDKDPQVIIKNLRELGFDYMVDSFGKKVFRATPYPANEHGGEFRVGLVLQRGGVLKLDVRPWGTY